MQGPDLTRFVASDFGLLFTAISIKMRRINKTNTPK